MENVFGAVLDPEVLRREALDAANREQAVELAKLTPQQQVTAVGGIFGGQIGNSIGQALAGQGIALGPTGRAVLQEKELGRMQDAAFSVDRDPLKSLEALQQRLQSKGMGRQAAAIGERIAALKQSRIAAAAETEKAAAEIVYKQAQAEKLFAEAKQIGKPTPTDFEKAAAGLRRAQESGDPEAIADATRALEALRLKAETQGMSPDAQDLYIRKKAAERGDTALVQVIDDAMAARRKRAKDNASTTTVTIAEDAGDLTKIADMQKDPLKSAAALEESMGDISATQNMLEQVYEIARGGLTGGALMGSDVMQQAMDGLRIVSDALGLNDLAETLGAALATNSTLEAATLQPLLERLKGVGGNDTEREMERMRRTLPGSGNTPQAILDIARMMRISLDQARVKQQNIAKFRSFVRNTTANAAVDKTPEAKKALVRVQGLTLNKDGVTGDAEFDRAMGLTPLPTYTELAKKYERLKAPEGTFTPGLEIDPAEIRKNQLLDNILGDK